MADIIKTPAQPSARKDLLKEIIDKRITKLIRYSWWPAEDAMSECHISQSEVFALTAGPLVICFENGLVLGVASDPELNSVIVWDEISMAEAFPNTKLEGDEELFPILATNEASAAPFWQGLVGSKVIRLSILKKKSMTLLQSYRPSEVGLCFYFEGGDRFFASHGLANQPDDFAVLESSQVALIDFEEYFLQ